MKLGGREAEWGKWLSSKQEPQEHSIKGKNQVLPELVRGTGDKGTTKVHS